MDQARLLATEKAILRDPSQREELRMEVKRFEPAKHKNEVSEDCIGRFRPFDRRMCVTAEMDIIRQYLEQKTEPPTFLEAGPREYLYFPPEGVRIGIVTPGGIAPGVNTVIHSIVNMHWIYGMRKQAYGFLGGFQGIVEDHKMDLNPDVTKEWIRRGGSGLGARREEKDPKAISAIATQLHNLGVKILYVIGGDGSLTAAHLVAQELDNGGKKIVIAGVPKTMDNDILWVWHSFGFDTAAEEATRLVNAVHEEARSTGRVCLMPLFGRDAGFVAAHAALGSGQVDVVLVPEVEFKIELVLDYVQGVVQDQGYALVVLAEGACPQGHTMDDVKHQIRKQGLNPDDTTNPRVSAALRAWRLYIVQTKFEEHFGAFNNGRYRVFVNEPRYLIRAIPANAVDQVYCQRLADLAVHNALAGFTDFMISQWLTEYVLVPLGLVADRHKRIPPGGIFWTTVTNSTGQPSFV